MQPAFVPPSLLRPHNGPLYGCSSGGTPEGRTPLGSYPFGAVMNNAAMNIHVESWYGRGLSLLDDEEQNCRVMCVGLPMAFRQLPPGGRAG